MSTFMKADPKHVASEKNRLHSHRVYLRRYINKTLNKIDHKTFVICTISSRGAVLDIFPKDEEIRRRVLGEDLEEGDILTDCGINAVAAGLEARRSRCRIGEENENEILKKYAMYFSVMNMNDIYEPYDLQPPCGILVITPREYANEVLYALAVGFSHDIMMNVQFQNTSIRAYERSGKGVLVGDSMIEEGKYIISYCNKRLFRVLNLEPRNVDFAYMDTLVAPLPDNPEFWDIMANNRNVNNVTMKLKIAGVEREVIVTTDNYIQPSIKTVGTVFYITTQRVINEEVSRKVSNGAVKTFDDIIGRDPALLRIIDRARRMAQTDSNILILGESGTGKDVMAQAIHNGSSRNKKPFVAINCSAIPKDLIESELFGYEPGAFTGARKNGNIGKFELANGGTIFLDEIGEMPLDLQAKLLRLVEQKQLMRLGGSRLIDVDVKIIAATNIDIWGQIERKLFRADLFYRLSTMRINLMPLRERRGDILLLADYFIRRVSERIGRKDIMHLTEEAEELLVKMDWYGNIRELQSLMECIVQLYPGDLITARDILENTDRYYEPTIHFRDPAQYMNNEESEPYAYYPNDFEQEQQKPHEPQPAPTSREKASNHSPARSVSADGEETDDNPFSRRRLEEALIACGGNRTKAAEYLGISRRTLYRKMDEAGLS